MYVGVQSSLFSPREDEVTDEDLLVAIDSTTIEGTYHLYSRMTIQFPRSLIQSAIRSFSNIKTGPLRFGSFIYDNITGIFPSNMPGRNK